MVTYQVFRSTGTAHTSAWYATFIRTEQAHQDPGNERDSTVTITTLPTAIPITNASVKLMLEETTWRMTMKSSTCKCYCEHKK